MDVRWLVPSIWVSADLFKITLARFFAAASRVRLSVMSKSEYQDLRRSELMIDMFPTSAKLSRCLAHLQQ